MESNTVTRRSAIRQTAAFAAATFPAIVPAAALGLGAPPPSDRITLGAIGVGARGTAVLRDFLMQPDGRFVAMCDVNSDNLSRAIHLANERYGNKDCRGYVDFQELLDRADIDAVFIAPPHHWRVAIGVAAQEASS